MKKLLSNWGALSLKKQITAIAAAAAVALAIVVLAQVAARPPMALLYTGLDLQSSGDVLSALEGKGVRAEVRGDAIYVPKNRRDSLRLELASDGLPKQGQAGFEALEKTNGFSTTTEMFDAVFWRAQEGELARTIVATPGVRSARVHLAVPKREPFARNSPSPSASVTVSMSRGVLTREQAQSMRFIVALAVPGLNPEKVAIIDSVAGVILAPNEDDTSAQSDALINSREAAIERSLLSLLEARVGAGNVRVSVSVELTKEKETLTERTLDPKLRALTERASTERSDRGSTGGVVTVASNLPEGDAGTSASPDQSSSSETNETTRYEVSETRRERITPAGAVRRIQVAVLVNDLAPTAEEEGAASPVKRSESELASLKKLVSAAIGYDEARGDVVTIESLAFDKPSTDGTLAAKRGVVDFLKENLFAIMQLVVPAIVALILALFVLKPILSSRPGAADASAAAIAVAPPAGAQLAIANSGLPSPFDQLQRVAAENADASTSVLQAWFEEREQAS